MKIKEIAFQDSLAFKDTCKLLLLTATDIERQEVLKALTPLKREEAIYVTYKGALTYYIGAFGAYGAILVKSGTGIGRADGAIMTTHKAIQFWEPKAIVMIGIAFGVDKKEQRIGDVLVSEQIIPYDVRKEGKSIPIYRAEHPPASLFLRGRFSEVRGWTFKLPDGQPATYSIAPMLSGEVFINNKAFRDNLVKAFPKVRGGDMEATGVYVVANESKIDWIVIKAICGFADGTKDVNKEANQLLAIQSAISLAKQVFSSKYAFGELGLVLVDKRNGRRGSRIKRLSEEEKDELRELIGDDEIEQVFEQLNAFFKSQPHSPDKDTLITIQREYNKNVKTRIANIADTNEIRLVNSQITDRLLKLINIL